MNYSLIYKYYLISVFFRGDILKVVEDLIALEPSIFCAVPRLYTRIHDKVRYALYNLLLNTYVHTRIQAYFDKLTTHRLYVYLFCYIFLSFYDLNISID